MSVSKNTIKKIGHCACLGDIMGQAHHIYARIGTNHARHFIGTLCCITRVISSVHFAAAGSKGFKSNT